MPSSFTNRNTSLWACTAHFSNRSAGTWDKKWVKQKKMIFRYQFSNAKGNYYHFTLPYLGLPFLVPTASTPTRPWSCRWRCWQQQTPSPMPRSARSGWKSSDVLEFWWQWCPWIPHQSCAGLSPGKDQSVKLCAEWRSSKRNWGTRNLTAYICLRPSLSTILWISFKRGALTLILEKSRPVFLVSHSYIVARSADFPGILVSSEMW